MHWRMQKSKEKYFLNDCFPHCLAMELQGFHTNEKHFSGSLLCGKHCTRYWSPSLQRTNNRMTVHNHFNAFAPLETKALRDQAVCPRPWGSVYNLWADSKNSGMGKPRPKPSSEHNSRLYAFSSFRPPPWDPRGFCQAVKEGGRRLELQLLQPHQGNGGHLPRWPAVGPRKAAPAAGPPSAVNLTFRRQDSSRKSSLTLLRHSTRYKRGAR